MGITAIELAEKNPPYANDPPMRVRFVVISCFLFSFKVLFNIPNKPPPKLSSPDKYSPEFKDFIAQCLIKDPEQRPTAEQLLHVNDFPIEFH